MLLHWCWTKHQELTQINSEIFCDATQECICTPAQPVFTPLECGGHITPPDCGPTSGNFHIRDITKDVGQITKAHIHTVRTKAMTCIQGKFNHIHSTCVQHAECVVAQMLTKHTIEETCLATDTSAVLVEIAWTDDC
jgi:hypothetical protein